MVILLNKLSKEDQETLNHIILDDSTKINSFLSDAFEEQSKSQKKQFLINTILVVIGIIISIITLIVTVLN